MARTIIHIGMPRTASTFLQREFFPHVSGFEFYGVDRTQYSDVFQKILYQDDSYFNAEEIATELKPITEKNAILSNELFAGQSLYLHATNRSRTARRLKQFFPDAEILLVLRNQVSLLESLYSIGIYSGMTVSPEDYIRFSNEPSNLDNPLYPTFAEAETTEGYYFSNLIELYRSLFPNVHVLLFEDFKSGPAPFAERLSQMLNLKTPPIKNPEKRVNKSLSARQIKLIRRLNLYKPVLNRGAFGKRVFRFKLRFVEHRLNDKKKFKFPDSLQKKLRSTFINDNRKLADMLPELKDSKWFTEEYLGDNQQ